MPAILRLLAIVALALSIPACATKKKAGASSCDSKSCLVDGAQHRPSTPAKQAN